MIHRARAMLHIVTLLIACASYSTTADKARSLAWCLDMSSEGSALADKIVWPKFLEHHLLV